MITFKNWLATHESSASTRRATGPYVKQPGDVFVRPPYGKESTCKFLSSEKVKTHNMDVSDICGKKGGKKSKAKKPKNTE